MPAKNRTTDLEFFLEVKMIREYQEKDLEQVLSVWADASKLAHSFLSNEFLASERKSISEIYLPKAETWVFEVDGSVVGFISLLGNEVGGFFVAPKRQGHGIGRALMDHAKQLRGNLEVEVFSANLIGRAFYSKYGFILLEEKRHEQTGFDLLRLGLTSNKLQ